MSKTILLTGVSGYIGGRLVGECVKAGHSIKCLARYPHFVQDRLDPSVEILKGDVLDKDSLYPALENVDTAFYLIHSMGEDKNFAELERQSAHNFIEVAEACGVKRIIYLGGLVNQHKKHLSEHLKSRLEVGEIFRQSKVPSICFRASIILGSGSLSYELVKNLTERLPLMITPKWTKQLAQPIGIRDVLAYLIAAVELPDSIGSQVYEIGGKDQVSYVDIMKAYAALRGLKRIFIPVPVLSPRISSLWLGLVTPLYARVGKKLIRSVKNSSVVTDSTTVQRDFSIHTMGFSEALKRALDVDEGDVLKSKWSDAVSAYQKREAKSYRYGKVLQTIESIQVKASMEKAFRPVMEIGGKQGWYYADFLWEIRGLIDLLIGGPGLKRGRRSATELRVGDALDWWRVVEIIPHQKLVLEAEMLLPGKARLAFEASESAGLVTLTQKAVFEPIPFWGPLYWYLLLPIHHLIFKGMLKGVKQRILENH